MAISLLGYWLYPTAPPRFLPELGLDPASSVTGNTPLLSSPGDPLFNPFAAVPSMHAGLSMIFAWSLALLVSLRPLKVLLFAYPLLMTYVVVASGNHFWLDALLGAFTAAAAAGVAILLGRLHPDWSFRPETPSPEAAGVAPGAEAAPA
jgi:membrane-associated phospholipid phosphatase